MSKKYKNENKQIRISLANISRNWIDWFIKIQVILIVILAGYIIIKIIPENVSDSNFLDIKECLELPQEDIDNCYSDFIEEYAGDKSIKELLSILENNRRDEEIENFCHPMTHAIGRYSLDKYGQVGDAFDACDFTCHSGCYHGVMERLFLTKEDIANGKQHITLDDLYEKVPSACDRENFNNPTDFEIFNCLHGVGHAILYSIDYDIRDGLKVCDTLSSQFERSSCYGGLFMENVTAFDKSQRDIIVGDYHYPCTKVDSAHQVDCYMMQTSIMLEFAPDDETLAQECSKIFSMTEYENKTRLVESCFTSIGRDLSNSVRLGNPKRAFNACRQVPEYTSICNSGVTNALIDNSQSLEFTNIYCDMFSGEIRESCFQNSESYLNHIVL